MLQSQTDSDIQQRGDYQLSRGSKMLGWISTSHEAQVQSPAALGLGQVETPFQHSMLSVCKIGSQQPMRHKQSLGKVYIHQTWHI